MEKATRQIVFRATKDQYDFLKTKAEEQDRTMAKVLRRIVDDKIKIDSTIRRMINNEKEKEVSGKTGN